MALFRTVYTSFWDDPRVVEEMTPEDKLFFLYLLTNQKTTQIGVYQLTKKEMAFTLGYSTESINSLMDRFENHHKLIKYNPETREVAILNWGKHNFNKGGKPIEDCVKKELESVKDFSFVKLIAERTPSERFKTLLNQPFNDTSTIRGQKEEEKEKEKEEEKEVIPFVEIVNYFNYKTNSNYRTNTSKTKNLIKARWNEGFRLTEFKQVIDIKVSEWLKDKSMCKFLRPETLFGTKFESYLNQKGGGKNGTDSDSTDPSKGYGLPY
jgi:uncharacterized phage protein (TIGR02220 family)